MIEEILSENPDVDAYVRRTGAELGLFATQTNRGDIQVVLRPAEDDPISLLRKPVRPEFAKSKDEVKELDLDMHTTGRDYIRKKYRRRTMEEVRKEVQDEIEEKFTEHQFKVETVPIITDELNDLSGANKPVEVKLFGPDYHELQELAEEVGAALKKMKEKNKSLGIEDIDDHVFAGSPDLAVRIDGVRAARFGIDAGCGRAAVECRCFTAMWPRRSGNRPCASPTCGCNTPTCIASARTVSIRSAC